MYLPQSPGDSAGALPSEMSALLAEWPFRLEQKWTHTGRCSTQVGPDMYRLPFYFCKNSMKSYFSRRHIDSPGILHRDSNTQLVDSRPAGGQLADGLARHIFSCPETSLIHLAGRGRQNDILVLAPMYLQLAAFLFMPIQSFCSWVDGDKSQALVVLHRGHSCHTETALQWQPVFSGCNRC